jgi:hypothetical protein
MGVASVARSKSEDKSLIAVKVSDLRRLLPPSKEKSGRGSCLHQMVDQQKTRFARTLFVSLKKLIHG